MAAEPGAAARPPLNSQLTGAAGGSTWYRFAFSCGAAEARPKATEKPFALAPLLPKRHERSRRHILKDAQAWRRSAQPFKSGCCNLASCIRTKVIIAYNWQLQVKGGDIFERTDPVPTVFVDDDIDLDKLEIPAGVTLRSASEPGDNEANIKMIEKFMKQQKNLRSADATPSCAQAADVPGNREGNLRRAKESR